MTIDHDLKHWQVTVDEDQYVWANFDKQGSEVNSINAAVLDELELIIDEAKTRRGLVIGSAKKNGYIAGADIESFSDLENVEQAMTFIHRGQELFSRLESLSIPSVAMINGFCLGGGMELALACRYRVAVDDDSAKLGLPEVKLGIHPGWGGTIRLPKMIGAMKALDLILSGRTVVAKTAKKMGFVDAAVPLRQLKTAVRYYLKEQPLVHKASFFERLTNTQYARKLISWKIRKDLAGKGVQKEHYPQFEAVVARFERYGVERASAMQTEANSMKTVLEHPTARNLVRVYWLQERLKGFAKNVKVPIHKVHVIGAGVMGGEIAAWCALQGFQVTLQDREHKYIAPAMQSAHKLFKKKLKKPAKVTAALDRLMPDVEGLGIKTADVIIEAIFENLEAKQELFLRLEKEAKKDAVLATNTSTFPLEEISGVMKQPNRLLGIHFFNPVSKLPLVEIVKPKKANEKQFEKAVSFVGQIKKLPLPVKSSPGFLVNRVLMPYLMECVALVDEGVPIESIDKAARDYGMPMGPVTLADTVGLDICLHAAESLSKHFPVKVPHRLREKVEKGELGRKSGKGFYTYKNGKPVGNKNSNANGPISQDITMRLVMRLINEAVACLREQVVEDADLVDAGMIFGMGFAPFRGGPMHYCESEGYNNLQTRLHDLERRYGDRFNPDTGWNQFMPASES